MGCYETVMVPCPNCSERYPAQSKGGPCELRTFDLADAPADVMSDVNRHAPFCCEKCGTWFAVEVDFSVVLNGPVKVIRVEGPASNV